MEWTSLPCARRSNPAGRTGEAARQEFEDAVKLYLEEQPLSTLYLNLNNPLVGRLMTLRGEARLSCVVRVLYVQALLAGGHPLRGNERKTMNEELLNLIDHSITTEKKALYIIMKVNLLATMIRVRPKRRSLGSSRPARDVDRLLIVK